MEKAGRGANPVACLIELTRADQCGAEHVERPRLHRPFADPGEDLERLAELAGAAIDLVVEVHPVSDPPERVRATTLIAGRGRQIPGTAHLVESDPVGIALGA